MRKFKELSKLDGVNMDKTTVSRILGYVEKYCTEVEEVEELLWNLLDAIQDEDSEEFKGRKIVKVTRF